MSLTAHADYIIPGRGSADATVLILGGARNEIVGAPAAVASTAARRGVNDPGTQTPIVLPASLAMRALIVTVSSSDGLDALARSAHERGFSDLWVDAPRNRPELIAAAVKIGAANGLAIRAVVPLFRGQKGVSSEALDNNIIGETISAHADWWHSQLQAIRVAESTAAAFRSQGFGTGFGAAWANPSRVSRLLNDGDYLRCDAPAVQSAIAADIAHVASVAGLAGVVLRDTRPPGYSVDPSVNDHADTGGNDLGIDPLLQLGYSDSLRLAFLRKNSVDPVDVSPLWMGDQLNTSGSSTGQPSIALPFFPDSGTRAQNSIFNPSPNRNRSRGDDTVLRDEFAKWSAFRAGVDTEGVDHVVQALKAKLPTLSVIVKQEPDPFRDSGVYFAGIESPMPPQRPPQIPSRPLRRLW